MLHLSLVPQCQMVRYRGVGTKRPKKKKSDEVASSGAGTGSPGTGPTAVEEPSAATSTEPLEQTPPEPKASPGKALREEAAEDTARAVDEVEEATVVVRKAEAALTREKRLREERNRRWEAAERRKEPPPAWLQLERLYKSRLKFMQAELQLSEAKRVMAEADGTLITCFWREEELENARLRRELRRHKKRKIS
jgi:hypothetical protein